MKKVTLLASVVFIATTFFTSCGLNANVELKNQIDSLNYAFGAANGDGIRQYVIGADTLNNESIKQFAEGFAESFCELEGDQKIIMEGTRFAQTFVEDTKSGKLFGDPTIVYNEKLFMETLENSLRNKPVSMTSEVGMAYVQTVMFVALDSGAVRSQGQVDSINIAYAVVNGNGIRTYLLGKDTTEANINTFMKSFKKSIKGAENKKMYYEGQRIGLTMYGQVTSNPNLMNDPALPMNKEIIKVAVLNAIKKENQLMDGKTAANYFNAYIEKKMAREAEEASVEGVKFLEENKTKEGVVTTESGLQYVVNVMGKGEKPTADSKVKVHYEGRLLDGKVFDSSIQRGEPISFPLGNVIKGWTEGLQLMPVGSKFTFYIPYQLGYGEKGAGNDIPPYATLIFDVELLGIEK